MLDAGLLDSDHFSISEGEYSIRMSAHKLSSTEYSLLKYSQVCRALHN